MKSQKRQSRLTRRFSVLVIVSFQIKHISGNYSRLINYTSKISAYWRYQIIMMMDFNVESIQFPCDCQLSLNKLAATKNDTSKNLKRTEQKKLTF